MKIVIVIVIGRMNKDGLPTLGGSGQVDGKHGQVDGKLGTTCE